VLRGATVRMPDGVEFLRITGSTAGACSSCSLPARMRIGSAIAVAVWSTMLTPGSGAVVGLGCILAGGLKYGSERGVSRGNVLKRLDGQALTAVGVLQKRCGSQPMG